MQNKTKQALGDALLALARTTPVRKLQVKDICKTARLDRTTFYHHFRDKYDLLCWVYMQYFLQEAQNTNVLNDEEMLTRINIHLYSHKKLFADALMDHSQNNLRQYMQELYLEINRKALCRYLKVDLLDEETSFELGSYVYACMGHTIEWITGRLDLTPEKYAYFQYKYMPRILKEAWKYYPAEELDYRLS